MGRIAKSVSTGRGEQWGQMCNLPHQVGSSLYLGIFKLQSHLITLMAFFLSAWVDKIVLYLVF